jgi:aryl-alcohol dehydrogenase-like predicted oxidoreductase
MQTTIPKIQLWNYAMSRIINWWRQLSWGHGDIEKQEMINILTQYAQQGVTTFDCADIYTGVEELYGAMRENVLKVCGEEVYKTLKIQTKCVPDLQDIRNRKVDKQYIEAIIDRSLQRLWQDQLDLVQLHHRDYTIDTYKEIATYLQEIQQAWKINQLWVTNYNTKVLWELLDIWIPIVSTQNQYSILDHRPEKNMSKLCKEHGMKILCYGTLAWGLLSNRYIDQREPQKNINGDYENRSLKKYMLIIEDFGGRKLFQELLTTLNTIAIKHHVTLSDIAMKYILEKPEVWGIIVWSRNAQHVNKISSPFSFNLDTQDYWVVQQVLQKSQTIREDCFDLERDNPRHSGIMKKNLNRDPSCSTE